MSAAQTLDTLEQRHPEWAPWLAVLREVSREIADARWDAAAPVPGANAPLISGVRVRPEDGLLADWWARLRRSAAASASPLAALQTMTGEPAAALRVFDAALNHDEAALAGIAREAGLDAHALHALAALLPMPFLHACRRRWADAVSRNGREGNCPTCGAWPALVEMCGVDRKRILRCGRCGSGWEALVLSCPYCDTTDHDRLATLVPGERGAEGTIEVCNHCRGYIKAFARLTPAPAERVMLDDLASVALDLAAAERGYARPKRAADPRAAPTA